MTAPLIVAPATCAPRLPARLFGSGGEIWRVTAEGMADYWTGALRRGATSWDVASDAWRWWQLSTRREAPRWWSPHEIVLQSPLARLRDFSRGATDDVVPTLVLPPQAGHDSCIVDFSPAQSQMKVIRAAGLTRAYAADWIGATGATKDARVEDYLDFVDRCVAHIGEPVNLVGDCQGGWLAVLYAALRPESVHTLTIAGAPVDFHAGEGPIREWVDLLGRSDLAFYRWVVSQGGGVLKGEYMLNGFIAIKPENEVAKQVQLLSRLHDPQHVERHQRFETWFKHTQDIPGAFYLWIVEHLFAANRLVRGELEVRGERVELARIACPVFLLAGERDHITPPEQVFALADHVATPPAAIARRTAPSGHLGLFMGSEALREHWPPLLAEVYVRSRPKAGHRRRQAGGLAARAERRARAQTTPAAPPIPAP